MESEPETKRPRPLQILAQAVTWPDVVILGGAGALVYGIAQVSVPLAYVALGAMLILLGGAMYRAKG